MVGFESDEHLELGRVLVNGKVADHMRAYFFEVTWVP